MEKIKIDLKLLVRACDRCGRNTALSWNFCGYCYYLINPVGYFNVLANLKRDKSDD